MNIKELDIDKSIGSVGEVLDEKQKAKGLLIHALHAIQKEHNYLPEEELLRLARKLHVPVSEVYSTATFYKQFYFSPRGRTVACVCMGTACHVRGAGAILDGMKEEFGIKEGETSRDMAVTLETVGCVGCCGLAPVVTVNDEVSGEVTVDKLQDIIKDIRSR